MDEQDIDEYLVIPSSQLSEEESVFEGDSDYEPDLSLNEILNNSDSDSEDENTNITFQGPGMRTVAVNDEGHTRVVDDVELGQQEVVTVVVDNDGYIADGEGDDVDGVSAIENVPLSERLQNLSNNWGPVGNKNDLTSIPFNKSRFKLGINPDYSKTMVDCTPYDFWKLFVKDEVINKLVTETNRYADQQKNLRLNIKPNARINKWVDVDFNEMQKFLGVILYMGLNPLPTLGHYWQCDDLYFSAVPRQFSRNRFELILSLFHCANNEAAAPEDRLYKIRNIVDDIVNNFQEAYTPEQDMCIDESMVPFLGRLFFRQYVKGKRHKYGIKIFKLCVKDFYTLGYKIYCGKEANPEKESISEKVVMELLQPYLNCGRTLYVDNWYSSVTLAQKLLDSNTYIVGTLRKKRKLNPPDVVTKKLKKGEKIARKNGNGVVVLKWKDKRDILMISTKHVDEMRTVVKHGKVISKPGVILDYNKGKSLIDLSDQMSSYHSPLRRTLK